MNYDGFEKVYNECYPKLYTTAKIYLKNAEDAEDAVQDTFIRYINYDKPIEHTRSWLNTVVINICKDRISQLETRKTDPVDDFPDDIEIVPEDNDPIEIAVSDERDRAFMDILENSLSDDVRRTLLMASFEDMSTKEIAEVLGIPQGTVSSRINAAKSKLKIEVKKYEEKNKTKLYSVSLPMLAKLFARQAAKVMVKPMSASLTAALSASAETASATAATVATAGAVKAATGITVKQIVIICASVLVVGTAVGGTIFYINYKDVKKKTETTVIEIEESDDIDISPLDSTIQIEESEHIVVDVSLTSDSSDIQTGNCFLKKAYEYNSDGSLKGWTEYEYDKNGNNVKTTSYKSDNSISGCQEYEYDENGNTIKLMWYDDLLNGAINEYEYDASGNKVKQVAYNLDGVIVQWYEWEYDENGYIIKANRYDIDGNIEWWIEYENDDSGNILKSYNYDSAGVIEWDDEYSYDSYGNLVKSTHTTYGDGLTLVQVHEYLNEYDLNGNLIKLSSLYSDGSVYSSDEYDAYGNVVKTTYYEDGSMISVEYEYEYDEYGNVVKEISYYSDGSMGSWYEYEYEYS